MSNSCTLHTGQSTDGRPTIGTTQRPLTESLYTVAIELDGGTMLITTTINVPHTTERLPLPDFTLVFDEAELPTWVDALFGEDVADIFFETLTAPSSQPRTIPLTLSDLATDHLRAMARYAEGLWIRRYWPATREIPIEDEDESAPQTHTDLGYEALPATSTFLTDLELVALAADSLLSPILGDSQLIATLISLRFDDAAFIFDKRDRIVPRYRPLVLEILRRFFDLASDEEYDACLEDPTALAIATEALNTLDEELEGHQLVESTPANVFYIVPFELGCPPDIAEDDLALAAGSSDQQQGTFDTQGASWETVIDWTKNTHCLFDPAQRAQCVSRYTQGKGFVVTVSAPLVEAFPEGVEPELAYARITWEGTAEPIVFPLHLNADRTKMEGSGRVPGRPTSIDVVSVDDPGPVAHPSECYAIEEDQEHALDGASARIRECRLSENAVDEYSWTPPETPHSFPWLCELVAAFQKPSIMRPTKPEEGAGLWE